MYTSIITVPNETGLHARPASQLAELCQTFDSELRIYSEEDEIDPKSIISILSGGIGKGSIIKLTAEGSDAQEAGKAITAFIESLTE